MDDHGERKRTKTRRRVSVSPPVPASPLLLTVVVMGGILAAANAIMSANPVLWGVVAGGLFLAALLLVVRSQVPVRRVH